VNYLNEARYQLVNPNFEAILCDTPEARNIHYKLRYNVYSQVKNSEDPVGFTDGKEKDCHDRHSIQFLSRDSTNRQWVAAMRLVLAGRGILPLEEFCGIEPVPQKLLVRHTMVEFSRLCMLQNHRQHNRDRSLALKVVDDRSGDVKTPRPNARYLEIMLGLINATFEWSRRHDIHYCYFLISQALARTFQRLNLDLRPAGEPVELRGLRTPYIVDLRATESRMKQKLSVFREMSRQGNHYRYYSELDEDLSGTTMA